MYNPFCNALIPRYSDPIQISDIVVGQEDLSAREALLRWARRSTTRYPGVRVNDFTGSWRDGLAFAALIHRNRPDLLDWRKARSARPRDRLESAFHAVEKEYGVTRLLDPEGEFEHVFFVYDRHSPPMRGRSCVCVMTSCHTCLVPQFDGVRHCAPCQNHGTRRCAQLSSTHTHNGCAFANCAVACAPIVCCCVLREIKAVLRQRQRNAAMRDEHTPSS